MSNTPVFLKSKENECVIGLIHGTKELILNCLEDKFEALDPFASEGAGEKHLPVIEVNGSHVTVRVGSTAHPMTDEHSINWVYLQTQNGGQLKKLASSGKPEAEFALAPGDKITAAYAYCNLHGFWKAEM